MPWVWQPVPPGERWPKPAPPLPRAATRRKSCRPSPPPRRPLPPLSRRGKRWSAVSKAAPRWWRWISWQPTAPARPATQATTWLAAGSTRPFIGWAPPTPPSPETFTKSFKSKNPDDFWQLVGDAGYKLKEIATDVGVVPDVGFKFRYVRELSDGDINWLERKLRKHEEKYHDPLSYAQRAIIYTLLSINSSDVYFVEELKVKLLPLPTARFALTPWDSGLSWEHDTLLRAIQGQKHVRRKPTEEESHY